MWCIEKIIYIFTNILQKDFIPKVLSMKKWKWPQKGLQSLSHLSPLAHLIVIAPIIVGDFARGTQDYVIVAKLCPIVNIAKL
jgi:hypothetical protein